MITYGRNLRSRHQLLLPAALLIMALISGCGGGKEDAEETTVDLTYRYDHIDKIAGQYAELLMTTTAEEMEMERLLMDINSRCYKLLQKGDTLTALYFRQVIEDKVRARDAAIADSIFGPRPYSAFTTTPRF